MGAHLHERRNHMRFDHDLTVHAATEVLLHAGPGRWQVFDAVADCGAKPQQCVEGMGHDEPVTCEACLASSDGHDTAEAVERFLRAERAVPA